jgi:hypothetical protein
MTLDQGRSGSSPTQGFDSEGAGSGKQIDGVRAADRVGQQIKDRFSNSILHRAGTFVTAITEFPPTKFTADDPHATGTAVRLVATACGQRFTRLSRHAFRSGYGKNNGATRFEC